MSTVVLYETVVLYDLFLNSIIYIKKSFRLSFADSVTKTLPAVAAPTLPFFYAPFNLLPLADLYRHGGGARPTVPGVITSLSCCCDSIITHKYDVFFTARLLFFVIGINIL